MDQGDAMHPPNSLTQFAPYLSQMGFVKLYISFIRIDEVEQLGSMYMLQYEAVVSGHRERVHEGNDVGVADMLKIEVSLLQVEQRMTDYTP